MGQHLQLGAAVLLHRHTQQLRLGAGGLSEEQLRVLWEVLYQEEMSLRRLSLHVVTLGQVRDHQVYREHCADSHFDKYDRISRT